MLFGVELRGSRPRDRLDFAERSRLSARLRMPDWGSGRVWVGATDLGRSLLSRVRKHALGLANDCRCFPGCGAALRCGRGQRQVSVGDHCDACQQPVSTRFIYWLSYPFPEHYLLRAQDGTARYPFLYRDTRHGVQDGCLYRRLLPKADHVFVQSEQMRLDVAAQGIPANKMTAVPMGVRVDFVRCRPAHGIAGYCRRGVLLRVCISARSIEVRRLDFLIRAFASRPTSVPAARLYIVGRGDDPSDELSSRSKCRVSNWSRRWYSSGNCRRRRHCDMSGKPTYVSRRFIRRAIFQSTSPTKLVEYMAMGKAVVANDHPEQKRVIEESGAGIALPYEEQPFADAIVKLLEDPEGARSMGERGRRYVLEHRTYGIIAAAVEKQLLEIVESAC